MWFFPSLRPAILAANDSANGPTQHALSLPPSLFLSLFRAIRSRINVLDRKGAAHGPGRTDGPRAVDRLFGLAWRRKTGRGSFVRSSFGTGHGNPVLPYFLPSFPLSLSLPRCCPLTPPPSVLHFSPARGVALARPADALGHGMSPVPVKSPSKSDRNPRTFARKMSPPTSDSSFSFLIVGYEGAAVACVLAWDAADSNHTGSRFDDDQKDKATRRLIQTLKLENTVH